VWLVVAGARRVGGGGVEDDQDDPADHRDEPDQDPPAAAVDVVQPPDGQRQAGQQGRQPPDRGRDVVRAGRALFAASRSPPAAMPITSMTTPMMVVIRTAHQNSLRLARPENTTYFFQKRTKAWPIVAP
jgi:hypothetical protein